MSVVAAVVVTWNGMRWIDTCLQSLLASQVPLDVIVVDNASEDGTAAYVAQGYSEVQLLTNAGNLGFARANNLGMRRALERGAEFVFLLNQDATVLSDSVGLLVQAMALFPGYGVVSPVHLNGDGTGLDQNFERYGLGSAFGDFGGWIPDDFGELMGALRPVDPESNPLHIVKSAPPPAHFDGSGPPSAGSDLKIIDVKFVNAAAWLISRGCLEVSGGFHPAFFMYGEDQEFLNRIRHAGFRAGVLPGAFIRHHRSEDAAPKSGVRKNLTSNYLANEARLIVLNPSLMEKEKRAGLRRLYGLTVLRSVRFGHPGVFTLLRAIRKAARQARDMGDRAAFRALRDTPDM